MWKLIARNKWTWTEWSWVWVEIEWKIPLVVDDFEIPHDFQWIRSYNEFISKYKNPKTWKFRSARYRELAEKLDTLNSYCGIDPIRYLYYLYYVEQLSAISIYDKLAKYLWYSNKQKNTFTKMFSNTFGWELRQSDFITEVGKNKIIRSNQKISEGKREIQKQTSEKIVKIFDRISREKEKPDNIVELIWKNQLERLKMFLEIYGYKREWLELSEYLRAFKNKYWLLPLTRALNEILSKQWYELKINKWRISELLNWKYNI